MQRITIQHSKIVYTSGSYCKAVDPLLFIKSTTFPGTVKSIHQCSQESILMIINNKSNNSKKKSLFNFKISQWPVYPAVLYNNENNCMRFHNTAKRIVINNDLINHLNNIRIWRQFNFDNKTKMEFKVLWNKNVFFILVQTAVYLLQNDDFYKN